MKNKINEKLVEFITLTDDVDELMELLSQSDSLRAVTENELNLRRTESALIRAKLKKLRQVKKDIHITDHAVVRYLGRAKGMDIDALKQEMKDKIPDDFEWKSDIEYIKIPIGDLQYVVRDGLIITVCPDTPRVKKDRSDDA